MEEMNTNFLKVNIQMAKSHKKKVFHIFNKRGDTNPNNNEMSSYTGTY